KNVELDETYHSISGAAQEALLKHVMPSGVLEHEDAVIGDVCFGLGYNLIVAIAEHQKKFPKGQLQIFAFENDKDILEKINEINYGVYEPAAGKIRELLNNRIERMLSYDIYFYEDDALTITLYRGDVKETLPLLASEVLEVVFFDPFSPKKQPELWSTDLLEVVYEVMEKDAVLTTYSCARVVRDNLKTVGFTVEDGPIVGRNSPGTLAIKRFLFD
ncbi:MAG: hypothetical protein KDK61_08495, partial [Simkania sp.]|nr:hypothetical protein [Simkania sp.]